MTPLTFLYNEYIARPKLTEQKKPIWVYSSSPPPPPPLRSKNLEVFTKNITNYWKKRKIWNQMKQKKTYSINKEWSKHHKGKKYKTVNFKLN